MHFQEFLATVSNDGRQTPADAAPKLPILKLVRASRDYHAYANTNDPDHGHSEPAPQRGDPSDTKKAYFVLLREIGLLPQLKS